MPVFARLLSDLALRALDQQERQIAELRQRTGTVMASALLTASFFGAATVTQGVITLAAVFAGVSLLVTVVGGVLVLYPHELRLSADAEGLYGVCGARRPNRVLGLFPCSTVTVAMFERLSHMQERRRRRRFEAVYGPMEEFEATFRPRTRPSDEITPVPLWVFVDELGRAMPLPGRVSDKD
jgi:hypothetical protein